MPYAIIAEKPGGPGVLKRVEIAVPEPASHEVRVRHTAVGVNFVDTYYRSGLYAWPGDAPLILGAEAAGVIEAVGDDVSIFSAGDRVAYAASNGAYASHRVVDAQSVVALPDSIEDSVAAASMLKGLTVHFLLHRSFAVAAGQRVLFHAAAGGVGLIAGQWLASKGAIAIGTAGGAAKCALASDYGFSHVIDYRSESFVARVAELTGGAGVDVVYDSVGADTVRGSLVCLARFGHLVSFGQSSGAALDFKISDLAAGSFSLTRPTLFHYAADRSWLETASRELFARIGSGDLRIAVNQTFALAEASEAHAALESRATSGSTVLIP